MKTMRFVAGLAVLVLIAAIIVVVWVLPAQLDRRMNNVVSHDPYDVSPEAAALHAQIPVADLHADTLLWKRDPGKLHERGQTDLPRLREGGVALQVFATVTKSPSGLNYEENAAGSDDITRLAILQRWPRRTWGSIHERALYQAERLQALEERAGGTFHIIRSRGDVDDLMLQRAGDPYVLGGVLAMEGAHPLEGDLTKLDALYEAGFRVMGITHFFDNELGGSLHGTGKGGLTEFGREAVSAALDKGMIIDLAHASPAVVADVMAMTEAPMILSHTGINSLCRSPRNIDDDLMARIAERGGLIGIGFWEDVTCDASPGGIARMIVYAADRFGVDHIALGSDFDGTVETRLDATELSAITDALMALNMPPENIRKVMGENVIRFMSENLPV